MSSITPGGDHCSLFNEQGQRVAVDAATYNTRWSNVWHDLKVGQRFDAGVSSPILAKTLQELDIADVHQQRAIVPGCGYDTRPCTAT